MREEIISSDAAGQRLDRYLRKYLDNEPLSGIYKLLRTKTIKVNGKAAKENYSLVEGDVVKFFLSDETISSMMRVRRKISADRACLDIVYEDDEILVVDKPEGLLTHPDKNEYSNTLATRVQLYLDHLCTRTFRPAPVQRLDLNTSGLVLFCKTYDSLKRCNELMRERKVEKFYQCIVHGRLDKAGEIRGFLTKDEESNTVRLFQKEVPGSVAAYTKFRPLETIRNYSLVEVELLTGRSHQIRISLAVAGFPLIGDTKYGGRKVLGISTQILHAWRMSIDGKTFEKPGARVMEVWEELKGEGF